MVFVLFFHAEASFCKMANGHKLVAELSYSSTKNTSERDNGCLKPSVSGLDVCILAPVN